MLKVAIVGCGKIADSHASQIQRDARLRDRRRVRPRAADGAAALRAVSDQGSTSAISASCCESPGPTSSTSRRHRRAISDRRGVPRARVPRLRREAVHASTPPKRGRCSPSLTRRGSRSRPVTTTSSATSRGGCARSCAAATWAEQPVHMESYYCYDLTDPGYARALLATSSTGSAGCRASCCTTSSATASRGSRSSWQRIRRRSSRYGFASPLLRKMGEAEIVDELRVIIAEDERTTAYFTFSSQMRPSLHQFRLYGPQERPDSRPRQRDPDPAPRPPVQELRREVRAAGDLRRPVRRQPVHEPEDVPRDATST